MSRLALASLVCLIGLSVHAQEGPPNQSPLAGSLQGDVYTSATGAFKITIPVNQDLGGTVIDSPNIVTFQDPYSTYITIVTFPLDATQKWQLDTAATRKDYLVDFFTQHVLPDFRRSFPNVQVESSARFQPGLIDGAFFVYMTLPGGSMFAKNDDRIDLDAKPPVAKRANVLFVHNGFIFVISTELAERVTEGTAYHQTNEEEDTILKDRLIDVVGKMRFFTPAPSSAPIPPTP
jgi:hypothetical protein